MNVIRKQGEPDLATVYIAELDDGELIEFVESVQPPIPASEKWVLIVSTLRGCPVSCPICDAGKRYAGKLSAGEILDQIDYMVNKRYSDGKIPVNKFKIQFARMGDPAFNPAVLEVLEELPVIYDAPGLIPCISTVAPHETDVFFERLAEVKNRLYPYGNFQMQFSLHTSSENARRKLIPVRTWSFKKMSDWGSEFYSNGDRKIALNFAPVEDFPVEPSVIADIFSPEHFMIKLTPVNPTRSSMHEEIAGTIDPDDPGSADHLVRQFQSAGFDTILSIGETRENQIGSNCGMYVGQVSS
ncbi:MAG: radical SAM protein [Candidatus Aegiribacteria sp.]|nr:radical SAM protein [Candidatus Aegiribacteria sp.]